jgi:catalase
MSDPPQGWHEEYLCGCELAEAELIRKFMVEINEVQANNKARGHLRAADRALHAKTHAGICNARFSVVPELPERFTTGFLQPGKDYQAIVRFSNASGIPQPDTKNDLRGVAIRVLSDGGKAHDFLMTNAAASHARDAVQFMAFAKAGAGTKIALLPRLVWEIGLLEAIRMLGIVIRQVSRPVSSLATERFWSRSPYALGPYAVKFTLVPTQSSDQAPRLVEDNYLRKELATRLKKGPVIYDFKIQQWRDEKTTPIEDATVEWKEVDSKLETIAQLRIPSQDLTTAEAMASEDLVNKLEFNPWNTTTVFRPLGSLNRARRLVYKSSVGFRKGRENQIGRETGL